MFYRPGGSAKRVNAQYDMVYTDTIGGATGWLPVCKGNTIAVNICRAAITFQSTAQSLVVKSPVAPEAQIIMELKMFGGDVDSNAWPTDQWQNMVVATDRRAHRDGWARLRVVNINAGDGTGVAMAMQVSRTGESGAVT
jgi:hypothetical protein